MKATGEKKRTGTTKRQKQFKLVTAPGSQVSVAGTFNNWDPMANPMKDTPDNGIYKATLRLPPGRHEYKFVVNGEWRVDPNGSTCVPNEFGDSNSVVEIQSTP